VAIIADFIFLTVSILFTLKLDLGGSILAFFQLANRDMIDVAERVWSSLLFLQLGIALRRKLERR